MSSTIMMTGLSTFTNALTLADILSPPEISEPNRAPARCSAPWPDVLVTQPGLTGGRLFSRTLCSMRPGGIAVSITIDGLTRRNAFHGGCFRSPRQSPNPSASRRCSDFWTSGNARLEARCPGGRDRCAERHRWKSHTVCPGWTWSSRSSPSPFRSCLTVGFRLRRYDTSRFNQAVEVSVVPLPFCDRFGARRRSDVTTFNLAPVFSCLIHCATPGLGIAQRAFDRELSPIFIDDDQKMRRLAHRPHSSSASRPDVLRLRILELEPIRRTARQPDTHPRNVI